MIREAATLCFHLKEEAKAGSSGKQCYGPIQALGRRLEAHAACFPSAASLGKPEVSNKCSIIYSNEAAGKGGGSERLSGCSHLC